MEGLGFETEEVVEGSARLLVPRLESYRAGPREYIPSRAPVFYNPLMKGARDVAVGLLQIHAAMRGRGLRYGEPFAGVGVRGVRAALEVHGLDEVLMADIDPRAVRLTQTNIERNNVGRVADVGLSEADLFDIRHSAPGERFDYLDIDPFGSPAPYIDAAVQAVSNRGVLAFTATDMAALCGRHSWAGLRRYGGLPIRTPFPKEFGVRLLLYAVVASAAKQGMGAKPILAYTERHYARGYVLLARGVSRANEALRIVGLLQACSRAHYWNGVPRRSLGLQRCPVCDSNLLVGGPIWLGPLYDQDWLRSIMERTEAAKDFSPETRRLLQTLSKEETGIVGHHNLDEDASALGRPPPKKEDVILALRKMGYKASQTCFSPRGVRSNCGPKALEEAILRLSHR